MDTRFISCLARTDLRHKLMYPCAWTQDGYTRIHFMKTGIKRHTEYAGRARTPEETADRKIWAVTQLQNWAHADPVRLALLAERFPKGVDTDSAVALLSAMGPLRARGHFVLVDGRAVPPADETASRRLWRELWDPVPASL